MLTFADFQATGRDVACLTSALDIDPEYYAPMPGRLYAGDAYIEPAADGKWCLTIHNEGYIGTLADMEARLYLWCLEECPEDMGTTPAVADALCHVDKVIGFEILADIIATPRAEPQSAELLDGACDLNLCALWATDDDYDAADEVISALYALVIDNDYATDDTRSNGARS